MSTLIDELANQNVKTEIGGRWWIAKPVPFFSLRHTVKIRLKWVWEVLTGQAIAVHYKEDESTKDKPKSWSIRTWGM